MAPAKTPTESRNWLPLLLPVLAVLAGVVLWDRSDETAPKDAGVKLGAAKAAAKLSPREPAATSPASAGQSINPLAALSLDKLRDTVGRPLFEKSRRPVEPPAPLAAPKIEAPPPPPPAPAADDGALSLLGIVASEGRTIALLRRNFTGQNVRVEVGDAVDGWTIERIEPQRVTLRQGDKRIALQLFRKKPSK